MGEVGLGESALCFIDFLLFRIEPKRQLTRDNQLKPEVAASIHC